MNRFSANPLESRADAQQAVRDIVEPLVPHFSPGGARLRLGGPGAWYSNDAVELEGFSRPLWGLVPLAAGGGAFAHWDAFRRGLAHGTDPHHEEYWGPLTGPDQRMVEMAAIGLALRLVPDLIWDPLDTDEKANVVAWLADVDRHEPYPNNWQFFRVLVHLGLDHVGYEVGYTPDPAARERSLNAVDDYYIGDGWYRDGLIGGCDHYVAFAFHFYGLVYAVLAGDADPDRANRFRARAAAFAGDYRDFFDAHGRCVPYGRSMTYRFALAAFWAALAYAGEDALPWGEIKGLWLRNLRDWQRRPIFSRDGVLTVGYGYESLLHGEEYNSPCSPYWALKAFAPLALDAEHPFWQADAAPIDRPKRWTISLPEPRMVLSGDADQVVMAGGRGGPIWFRQGAAKYAKLVYSSAFGFSVESDTRLDDQLAPDSTLVVRAPGGALRVREHLEATVVGADCVAVRWKPLPDVTIDSLVWLHVPWHLRIHRIRSGRYLETTEGGFALGYAGDDAFGAELETDAGAGRALARTRSGTCVVVDLEARGAPRRGRVVRAWPNTSLIEPRTVIPVLGGHAEAGTTEIRTAVFASPEPVRPSEIGDPPVPPDRALQLIDDLA